MKAARFFKGGNGESFMVVHHDDIQVSVENLTRPWSETERGEPRRNKSFVLGRFEDFRVPAGAVEVTEAEAY